ncbi:hypothetical protein GWC95_13210 [Sediminibacterium roseum]|uniref:Type VI secretion system (T6SS), amidase effector protein 4 n=1 Tax=Sediminibacterium roseum TaxID=1978412 RepID=A0ABW9ZUR2_9BACT|nr:T6SS effector amidase Tae4 family protein [Sediminibacterium roseum]NCI50891.1 hypothetical protein [Sediminibacterium roseum]
MPPGFCGVYTANCDYGNCDRDKCKLIATLCWDLWIPALGGGTSWGDGSGYGSNPGQVGGGSSGGGNNNTGPDPNPPVPCEESPWQASKPSAPVNGQVRKDGVLCPDSPVSGWAPTTLPYQPPQGVADEQEANASDNDPENAWWDDNTFDPNTVYQPQAKPNWTAVFNAYPKDANGNDMPVAGVCALIGGQVETMFNQGNISNACALRVSRALNYAGIIIPAIPGQTRTGSDSKNYFLLASHLKNWLVKTFGPPDIHKTSADGAPNGTNFQNQLIGTQNRGIYIMKPTSATNFGASGHATLWGGMDCIGQHNYFAAASDVFIWKLPQ